MKHYVNFTLLFAFVILIGSAFLRFFEPFSLVVTSIHVVFGTLVLVLVGLHLGARLGYFRRMLAQPRTPNPKTTNGSPARYLVYSLLPCVYLLLACFFRWKPVPQLLELGHEPLALGVVRGELDEPPDRAVPLRREYGLVYFLEGELIVEFCVWMQYIDF